MKKLLFIMLIPIHAMGQSDTIVFRQQLDSVVIRATPPLIRQQPTGVSLNPQASLITKGSSILQALERAPGVSVDHRNGGIALNGRTGVRIMLDGKALNLPAEQVAGFLEGLNAENIERIDLFTSPPSGMDAEGGAGIINIVRKKNRRQGTSGSATVTAGYGYGEKANGRIQLAHRRGKWNSYGNYSFGHDRTYTDMFIPSAQDMPVYGGRLNVLVYDTSRARQVSHDITAGVDYTLDSHTTIGGSVTYNRTNRHAKSRTRSDFHIEPDSLLFYKGLINTKNRWNNLLHSVYLEKVKNNRTFTIAADYLLFRNNYPSDVRTKFTDKEGNAIQTSDSAFAAHQVGDANTRIQVSVLKIDYSKPVGKGKLETGVKGTWTGTNSGSGISGRPETMVGLAMNEVIAAGYVSMSIPVNSNTRVVAGARYEYASTIMNNPDTKERLVERTGGKLFPNITVSHQLDDRSTLSVAWSQRISRPAYNDLASFIRYSDPTAVYAGNPLLKASTTGNIDVRYQRKDLSLGLLLSRDKNPIARYQITENPERTLLFVSPQNLDWQNQLQLQSVMPLRVNEWWNITSTLNGGWRQFKATHTKEPVEKSYYHWSATMTQSFRMPKNFSAELSAWYNGPGYNGTIRVSGMGAVNAGMKKELGKNRGALQLSVSDLFSTMKITSRYGTLTREAFDITNRVDFFTESAKFPIFRLSYSRSFGTANNKRREGANSGSEAERNRINRD